MQGHNVKVIGAGIGGLCAALALRQSGAHVQILEKASGLQEIGAGIQISPNAFRGLRSLGVADRMAKVSCTPTDFRFFNHRGALHARNIIPGRYNDQFRLFHRADLIAVLADAVHAAGVDIRFDVNITHYNVYDHIFHAASSRETYSADLLVAADGVHSVARPVLNPTQPGGKFMGQRAWRALCTGSVPDTSSVRLFMGPGRHVVLYALRKGQITNVVAVEDVRDGHSDGWDAVGDPDDLRNRFSMFCHEVRGVLESVETAHVWGLVQRPVAENWVSRNLVLLGDAAHPTLPFLAQGAALAVEDAIVLGRTLADGGAPADYQALRHHRVRKIIKSSEKNRWAFHLQNPVLQWARGVSLRLGNTAFPDFPLRKFDWIYRHDPADSGSRSRY